MEPIQTIGNRIKILRKELRLTQEAFGERIYREKSIISKIENDEVELSSSIRLAICSVFGIREEWILTGEGAMKQEGASIKEAEPKNNPTQPDQPDSPAEFVTIPRFSDRISAGGGLVPTNEIDIKVAFRKDWIMRKGDPAKMSLIKVSGDSMEPTLLPDDLVLINHGHNHLDPQGGIYAIALDDSILIKRLQVVYPSGLVRVLSDNVRYGFAELPQDQVKINGRVIWYGREI